MNLKAIVLRAKDQIYDFAKNYSALLILLTVLGISGKLLNIALLNIIFLLVAGYLIGKSSSSRFVKSKFSQTIYGLIALMLVMSTLGTLAWLLRISMALDVLVISSSLVALLGTSFFVGKTTGTKMPIFDFFDLVSVSVVALYVVFIGIGIYRSGGLSSGMDIAIEQTATFGVDDLSHNNMYKDILEADQGLLLGSRDAKDISKTDNISYPKMSHLIGAAFTKYSFNTDRFSYNDYFLSYALMKSVLFLLSIYVICRTALSLTKSNHSIFMHGLGALAPLLATVLFFFHSFFQEGFYSVWPILIILPIFLLEIPADKPASLKNKLVVSMSFVAITMSWPLYGLPVGLVIAYLFLNELAENRRNIIGAIARNLPVLLIAPLGLTQLYVQLFDVSAPIDSSQINASGGIVAFPMIVGLVVCVLSLISIIYTKNLMQKQGLSIMMCSVLAITLLIGLSNIEKTGTVQYFFIKTAYIFLILGMIFISNLIARWTVKIYERTDNHSFFGAFTVLALVWAIVFGSAFMLYAEHGYLKYAGGYLISGRRNITAAALDTQLDSTKPEVVISLDSKLETYYLSTTSRSLNRFDYCMGDIYTFITSDTRSDLGNCKNTDFEITVLDNPKYDNQINVSTVNNLKEALNIK